jgi:outer membrane immunogenic protein
MKRIAIALLAGVAVAAGLGYSASAADLGVRAAPPPPAPSWTGFYIGVHAGGAWQQHSAWTFSDQGGIPFFATRDVPGNAEWGAVGGIQGGYNWQTWWPAWVVGVEGDISWASLSDHRAIGPLTNLAGVVFPTSSNVSMNANTNWLSSARAKLGFTGWFNNTMLYVTGGAAWANIEYNANTSLLPPNFAANFSAPSNFTTTKSGWVIGAGAEWMATTNILLRAEYLYYGINTATTSSATLFPVAVGILPTYTWSRENIQVFRIAGSYKFDPWW